MENKKTNNTLKIILILLLIVILILLIVFGLNKFKKEETKNEIVEIDTESTNLQVDYTDSELFGSYGSYNAKITLNDGNITIEGTGVTNNSNEIVIKQAGTYYITGSISDGNILIEAEKNDEVQLVLDNAELTSKTTAPINCVKAKSLTITLASNSTNIITDSSSYTKLTDAESKEPDATIFSKADLIINGTGKLIVNANYLDGIASKDGLKIINASIEINSKDDGIRGKDYVAINNAKINITPQGDGIKSTNDTDTSLGYIAIESGEININAKADGIQAETILNIKEATINITTSGEVKASNQIQQMGFEQKGGFNKQDVSTTVQEDTGSSKALKAGTEITIESGKFEINSTDDAIHSNGIIIINNGTFSLSSGDDGIHADTNIVINNGNINITKSYEGIESTYIEINGGAIALKSSDDGINISGGNDSSALNGRPGQNSFSQTADTNRKLVINGGSIYVNSEGDGLDSNGAIYINGGDIIVAGPTNGGNGALDYDSECVVTGGNMVIYGASGMWQNPSTSSTQNCITFQLSGKSGDEVLLKDESGNEIASVTIEKTSGAITFSNSKIESGKTYTLYVNGTSSRKFRSK